METVILCEKPGCQQEAKSICSRCNVSQYCNRTHQQQHWPQHKTICNATLTTNAAALLNKMTLGRRLVYQADLNVLTVSMAEALLKEMSVLLKPEAHINVKDAHFNTALHYLAAHGKVKVAQLLLEHKADVLATDRLQTTPLCRAINRGQTEMVHLLLRYGAAEGLSKWAEKHSMNTTRGQQGRNAGRRRPRGGLVVDNPLCGIAHHGDLNLLQTLISAKGDIWAGTRPGRTPLNKLFVGVRRMNQLWSESTQLAVRDYVATVTNPLDGSTLLMQCVHVRNAQAVDILLDSKACAVNARDKYGTSPLMLCRYLLREEPRTMTHNQPDPLLRIQRMLIQRGAT